MPDQQTLMDAGVRVRLTTERVSLGYVYTQSGRALRAEDRWRWIVYRDGREFTSSGPGDRDEQRVRGDALWLARAFGVDLEEPDEGVAA
jgi:hypothetical protein